MDILERVKKGKVIAIVRGLGPENMLKLADALYAGGIDMIEVTFNQAKSETWIDTANAIRAIDGHFRGKVLAGAGTVMTLEQLRMAYEAGAKYIISPNVNEAVIRATKALGMLSFPGALTPTECAFAKECGADIVKVFPAGELGPGYIKAIKAPLSHIDFMAVGGVSEKNAADFLRAGAVGVGVGGNLVNREWIAAGQFDKITEVARALKEAVE